jgi:hypothetical protein
MQRDRMRTDLATGAFRFCDEALPIIRAYARRLREIVTDKACFGTNPKN